MGRRVDAGGDRQHPGQHEGEQGQRQRQAQHVADQLGVGPLVLQRQAEIAVDQMLQPHQVLDEERLIEPILRPQRRDLLGRQRRARRRQGRDIRRQEVTRRRLDDGEDDERIDQHQQRQERQPLQDVPGHSITSSPITRGRCPVLRGGGGRPHRRCWRFSDLKCADISSVALALRPCGPPPPYDQGNRMLFGRIRCCSVARNGF